MARVNYQREKRQKDLERQRWQEEKRKRKLQKDSNTPEGAEGTPEPGAEPETLEPAGETDRG